MSNGSDHRRILVAPRHVRSDEHISIRSLERLLVAAKYVVATHGLRFAPIVERLENEIGTARRASALDEANRKLKALLNSSSCRLP